MNKPTTLRELLDSPDYRRPDGALDDTGYAAFQATQDAHPDGFVPEDELNTTPIIWVREECPECGCSYTDSGQLRCPACAASRQQAPTPTTSPATP